MSISNLGFSCHFPTDLMAAHMLPQASSLDCSIADFMRWLVILLPAGVLALSLPACSGSGSNGSNGGGSELEAPASPTGLEATSQDGAIGLGWDASNEADMYRVYRSTSSGVDATSDPLDTGIGSAEYVDDTAENGTKYFYVVTAVASEGDQTAESDPSGEVEKTPFSDPPDRP